MSNEIQEIKTKFGQSAESIIASGLSLIAKGKRYRCCNTYAHKHGDRSPSMSWDPDALQFHCFACGMNIDIYGYYREHLNYTHQEVLKELLGKSDYKETTMHETRNKFTEELKNIKPISSECVAYLKTRGLTEETIKYFELRTYQGKIAFPYMKYESIVGYKLRKPIKNPEKPKYTSITGSKPYLFNVQNVEKGSELIICEGELDCMILYQCGFTNVVSVGAGATSLETMVEQAKDFLDSYEILIIVADNDVAGNDMDKIFVQKFGDKVKLIDRTLYSHNDVNEEYVLKGQQKVIDLVESARFKIEGRRDLDKQPYKGIGKRTGKYIPTGIETIDYAINDLAPGCVTLITGRSNGGKTTFTKQIMANAIDNGNKVYLISGEGDAEFLINGLYQCVIGRDEKYYDLIKVNRRYHKEPKPEVLKALQRWHLGKFTMFNKGESKLKTIDQLFQMVEYEIKINKYELIVIDNLMSVLSVQQVAEKFEAQADFLQRCHDIAEIYKTHIILVLHPNKTYQKGQDMDFEQISGSSDIYNKADNIISVIREYDKEKLDEGIDGRMTVNKNRYYPELITCNVHFETETGLLLEIDEHTGGALGYKFAWEKFLNGRQSVVEEKGIQEIIGGDPCPWDKEV